MKDNLDFLDWLNIMSFVIGIMNYNENLTQGDKQDLMQAFDEKAELIFESVEAHLQIQDKKLNLIMEELNDSRGNLQQDSESYD